MRFMVLVRCDERSEAGVMPTKIELAEMGAFNEELAKSGVLLGGEGLHPTSRGARVQFGNAAGPTVVDGPFAEVKELISGFWIIQAASLEEACERMKKAPFKEGEIEIRQIFEQDDFGDAMTPELRRQEDAIRERERKNA